MAEELSPESKLYVKEELEKVRNEFKEGLKDAQSKTTKIFTTIALIVGLLASMGIYGLVKDYMKTTIQTAIDDKLGEQAVKEFKQRMIKAEGLVSDANNLHAKIVEYEKGANDILSKLGRFEQDPDGYARFGEIMFSWGTFQYKTLPMLSHHAFKYPFDKNCLVVILDGSGVAYAKDREKFWFIPMEMFTKANIGKKEQISYLAIGY